MPPELRHLFVRFNALGRMLPRDLDTLEDAATCAKAMLVVAEMNKVQAETDAYLERHRISAANVSGKNSTKQAQA